MFLCRWSLPNEGCSRALPCYGVGLHRQRAPLPRAAPPVSSTGSRYAPCRSLFFCWALRDAGRDPLSTFTAIDLSERSNRASIPACHHVGEEGVSLRKRKNLLAHQPHQSTDST